MVPQAADQGDAKAQYGLGFMYRNGQGVPQDNAEAIRWLRKAADQGYAMAQDVLGFMYSRGQGLSRDDAEAFRWYRKAADQNYAASELELGFNYFRGRGVPQDDAESLRWFRKAAGQGDKLAQTYLMVSYFKGQGAPRNYIEAIRWFGKVSAACYVALNERGPLGLWTDILAILSILLILMVPPRRWGPFIWLPWALLFAALASNVDHELLSGRLLWMAVYVVFAVLSATCAIGTAVQATRGLKCSANRAEAEARS